MCLVMLITTYYPVLNFKTFCRPIVITYTDLDRPPKTRGLKNIDYLSKTMPLELKEFVS